MAAQRLLSPPSEAAIVRSRKVALKRDVLKWLATQEVGWVYDRVDTFGAKFVQALTNVLWYIYGHHQMLGSRACPIPDDFKEFQGYNKPEKSWDARQHEWHAERTPHATVVLLSCLEASEDAGVAVG